jgi:hypothetical protein
MDGKQEFHADSEIKPKTPVTFEMMQRFIIAVIDEIKAESNEMRKKEFDSLISGVETRIEKMLEPLYKRVNELTEIINNAAKHDQGGGGTPQPGNKPNLIDLAQEAKALIETLQAAGLVPGGQSQDDHLIALVKRGLQRQEDKYLLRIINSLRKKGDLLDEEVEEVVRDKIDSHGLP